MKEKMIPQRMCIVCKQMFNKKDLLRIVKDAEGNVTVDLTGKQNGRGAYICKSEECAARCVKTRALNRAFKCEVSDEQYSVVTEVLENARK